MIDQHQDRREGKSLLWLLFGWLMVDRRSGFQRRAMDRKSLL